MQAPRPTRLFHITAMANLPAICAAGALLSKSRSAAEGIAYQNIAYAGAQGARARRLVPDPPGGCVHDFVPFYFAPRSPMLGAINRGRMAEFLVKERVPLTVCTRLGVVDGQRRAQVQAVLEECGVDLPVLVMTSWYF